MKSSESLTVASILLIFSGIIIFITSIFNILSGFYFATLLEGKSIHGASTALFQMFIVYGVITIILAIFLILAGIISLKKRKYKLTLIGSVIGSIIGFIVGFIEISVIFLSGIFSLIGLILIITSKNEFQQKQITISENETDVEKQCLRLRDRKDITLIINILAGFVNVYLFLLLFSEWFSMISPPNSPGDTEILVGMIVGGICLFIYVIFVIILALLFTRMKKEHLFTMMSINLAILCILFIGNIVTRLISI